MLILPSIKETAQDSTQVLLDMHHWLRPTYENMLVRNKAYLLHERIDSNMLNNISKMSKNNVTIGHISQIIGAVSMSNLMCKARIQKKFCHVSMRHWR